MSGSDPLNLHRARFLLPVGAPPLEDGCLVVRGGTLLAVGVWRELRDEFVQAQVYEYPEHCLIPALVNAHIHSELSHLAGLSRPPAPPSFPDWIRALLSLRQKLSCSSAAITAAAGAVLADQWASGVAVVADIGNTFCGLDAAVAYPGAYQHFHEYLGLTGTACKAVCNLLAEEPPGNRCSGHAPYSTHAVLLRSLHTRAVQLGQVLPIHVAESPEESELIRYGSGGMRLFLEERKAWDGSFQPTGIDKSGAVRYLHGIGLLDRHTLCVHGVQVTDEEIRLLAASRASICLCPGSNRFLGVGTAPVVEYLRQGILPALGTDSLASNPELSIWREMQILASEHPAVEPAAILAMATLGGAAALGVETQFGTLTPGKKAMALAVPLGTEIRTVTATLEYLVHGGASIQPQWLDMPDNGASPQPF